MTIFDRLETLVRTHALVHGAHPERIELDRASWREFIDKAMEDPRFRWNLEVLRARETEDYVGLAFMGSPITLNAKLLAPTTIPC